MGHLDFSHAGITANNNGLKVGQMLCAKIWFLIMDMVLSFIMNVLLNKH